MNKRTDKFDALISNENQTMVSVVYLVELYAVTCWYDGCDGTTGVVKTLKNLTR